jgi:hypothetical protein
MCFVHIVALLGRMVKCTIVTSAVLSRGLHRSAPFTKKISNSEFVRSLGRSSDKCVFERDGSVCVNAHHVVPNDFTCWPFAKN